MKKILMIVLRPLSMTHNLFLNRNLRLVLIGVAVFFLSKTSILAQDDILSQSLTLEEGQRISAEDLDRHTQALRNLYAEQIESYKFAEKEFQLAKTQQAQLATLSSVERTTQSAKVAMIERSDVLITYFNLLHNYLVMADDISFEDKENTSAVILSHIVDYQTHRQKIMDAQDRASLNQIAFEFDLLFEDSVNLVYRFLYALDLAQMNYLRLQAVDLYQELEQKQADLPLSQAKLAERDRAYLDINKVFDQISGQVDTMQQLAVDQTKNGLDIYKQGANLLVQTQTNLIKVLRYLQELASVI